MYRSNAQDRDDLISAIGIDAFYQLDNYKDMLDLELPKCYFFSFKTFIELEELSSEAGITWQEIEAYCDVRNIRLKQSEIDTLLEINRWSVAKKSEMREQSEQSTNEGING